MTDKELLELCQQYGREARKWKNKFVALLPEVYKRGLYRDKKFHSIYEFAAKLAGLSKNVVDEALRFDEKFKEMPKLKSLIPEVGLSKLRIVVEIANKETDEFWADKVQNMTRSEVETYIKDIRPGTEGSKNANLSLFDDENQESGIEESSAQNSDKSTFLRQLSEETILQLNLLKQKIHFVGMKSLNLLLKNCLHPSQNVNIKQGRQIRDRFLLRKSVNNRKSALFRDAMNLPKLSTIPTDTVLPKIMTTWSQCAIPTINSHIVATSTNKMTLKRLSSL